jgi:nucleoside-diphosphate-sugar epimerase
MIDRALVTGGAGFIGSHLVRGLLGRGIEVHVLDNCSTGYRQNLEEIEDRIEFLEGDIRDLPACWAACQGMDAVFHLAALGSVPRSIDDPLTSNAVNVEGTLNMLVSAKDAGVKRFVFSSSSSVYGDTPVLPKHEGLPLNPRSPYAVTKLAGEEYSRVFYRTFGLETVCLRYFNVFGPRQNPHSQYAAAIPKFITAIREGLPPTIFGDGEQSRDFTFVDNVVEGNYLAATVAGVAGEVFNLACGEQITVNQLVGQIAERMGKETEPQYLPERPGDVKHSKADISSAAAKLNFRPLVYFSDGLARTVEAFVSAPGG